MFSFLGIQKGQSFPSVLLPLFSPPLTHLRNNQIIRKTNNGLKIAPTRNRSVVAEGEVKYKYNSIPTPNTIQYTLFLEVCF